MDRKPSNSLKAAWRSALLLGLAALAGGEALGQGTPPAASVAAQAPNREPISADEKRRLLDEANELRQRAAQLRREGDTRQTEDNAACYKKFLVNACLDKAKKARLVVTEETRRLDLRAGDIEREVKRREREAAAQERIDTEPERREQAERDQAKRQADELDKTSRRAAHARQREQTKAAAARDRESRQRRDAAKASDRAEAEAKARERAEATRAQQAEIDRKIAEHDRKKAEKAAEEEAEARKAEMLKARKASGAQPAAN
jgi:colicin import membrane protein